MQFVNGAVFGAGFTLAAVLVIAACKVVLHLGVC